jgi:hypothetical protein
MTFKSIQMGLIETMADRIKLENIVPAGFDVDTGDEFLNITEEFVCGNCRHLVGQADKYCGQCGELLKDMGKIEHWDKGKRLTDKEFKEQMSQLMGTADVENGLVDENL